MYDRDWGKLALTLVQYLSNVRALSFNTEAAMRAEFKKKLSTNFNCTGSQKFNIKYYISEKKFKTSNQKTSTSLETSKATKERY